MIKHLIARGIGFSPGSVKFVPTLGLGIGEAIAPYMGRQMTAIDRTRTMLASDQTRAMTAIDRTRVMK